MSFFFTWYFLLTLLGGVTFPLAYHLFPNFRDRGYSLSRVLGLLLWSYLFWICTSLGLTQNDKSGIGIIFALLLALSVWIVLNKKSELWNFLKGNPSFIFTTEILFLVAFAFLAIVRAANPEILGTEKPMELAFINAVIRSPSFPPHDPWLSGYAISYYHFGYIMTGMLAKLTSTPGTAAFNLMVSLVFGLGAIGAYGILYNLLSLNGNHKSSLANSLLAPFLFLIVSNIEGLFHVFYTKGLFAKTNFWAWLNLQDMTDPPVASTPVNIQIWPCSFKSPVLCDIQTGIENFLSPAMREIFTWIPNQFWWWWRASRVIYDSDLLGNHQEVIDEFPFFSFLLGDLHPHVLAIPFGLLAIAFAFHIYLGASKGTLNLRGLKLHLSPFDLLLASLLLGGLAFLNTWDILFVAALFIGAYLLYRARLNGWSLSLLEDALLFALPLGIISYLLYLPFHASFSSQAGGLLPNLINPTRGTHLWMMFAPLFLPLLVYLYSFNTDDAHSLDADDEYSFNIDDDSKPNWKIASISVLAFALLLWAGSWGYALLIQFRDPAFVLQYLQSQGISTLNELFAAASWRRLESLFGLTTLIIILIPAVAHLFAVRADDVEEKVSDSSVKSSPFILLLIILGALLVTGPEFFYLRDQFGTRMNTIFKLYYQAWMLWSIAASYGLVMALRNLDGLKNILYRFSLYVVIGSALIYTVLGVFNRTNNFQPYFGYTLDDFDRVERETLDEAAAMKFLMAAPDGVVAEAIGGSYSNYARISTYTGLPTVLGWPGHESQWRGGSAEQGSRQQDIETLYGTNNWDIAQGIIQRYHIRYIYVGTLERSASLQEEKFKQHLNIVFQSATVVIYEAPLQ